MTQERNSDNPRPAAPPPQGRSAFEITKAIAQAIRDLKQVPSGVLYANLMGHLTIEQYQSIIEVLKGTGLVTETNHLLQWRGPSTTPNQE